LIQYSLIAGIAFLAYLLKGLTGFGPAIVFISLGSLVMDPIQVVVISPLLDIVAGCVLTWKDRRQFLSGYWILLALPLIGGVLLGSIGLSLSTIENYRLMLGTGIVILGIWFLLNKHRHEVMKS